MTDDLSHVHLPAVLADEFGVSHSEARRRIALGRVKLNGQTVTDLDVDLDTLAPGDPVRIEMESHPIADAIIVSGESLSLVHLTDHSDTSGERLTCGASPCGAYDPWPGRTPRICQLSPGHRGFHKDDRGPVAVSWRADSAMS